MFTLNIASDLPEIPAKITVADHDAAVDWMSRIAREVVSKLHGESQDVPGRQWWEACQIVRHGEIVTSILITEG